MPRARTGNRLATCMLGRLKCHCFLRHVIAVESGGATAWCPNAKMTPTEK